LDDDDVENRDDDDDGDVKKSKKGKKGKYSDEERMWAMLAHLGILAVGFLAPLIIWQMKKDESDFVARNGKEGLNFCITWTGLIFLTCGLAGFVMPIFAIIAGLAANRGEDYQYPLTIRFIT
jgi:uncharacterized Tic20 family protein